MKFKHGTRRRALEYEKDWVETWKKNRTFEKSVESRPADNAYVFYDGPPFITGVPHHGTLLSSIVKDVVPRYWTMKGKRVERVWGWDCHGLPAENYVEKQLNITDRRQIITNPDEKPPLDKDGNELPTITLEEYINKARESMVASSATWEGVIDRIGRWVEFKGAYRTMDKEFMESVWWAFKELYEKGKIYEGEKVLMYDTKFATPVSKNEVTMDNDAYQTVTDPSLYAKFKLKRTSDVSIRALSQDDGEMEWKYLKTVPQNENGFGRTASDDDLVDLAAFQKFTKRMVDASQGIGLPEGYVPQTIYWIEYRGEIVGMAKVRSYLNDSLRNEGGGHIGIGGIAKEYRGKGIGTEALGMLIDIVRKSGEKEVLLTAHETNIGSRRMIEKNGGVVEKMIDDPKFPGEKEVFYWIRDNKTETGEDTFVLAWTTTPWTLPANLMLAVSPELTYCEVEVNGERLIVAEEALERVMQDEKHKPIDYKVLRSFKGEELVGKSYEPLDTGSTWPKNEAVHKIHAADFVSHESGTGIVHIAPAYGEDDFELAKAQGVEAFHVIDDNGYYFDTNYKGLEVWENNKFIAKDLMERGVGWKIEYIRHEYPFNPRSKQRIMYRAIPSWFFDVQGSKPLMLEKNQNINWFPEHLKNGRFAKNIEQAPDWNLSRDRFWATAMPVWKGDKGTVKVIGSYAELKELSGVELEDYHRPWVDDITFEIDGEKFTRVDKVLDGWFESGSMPFAQFHYPFENKEKFEANFPGDFIVEYVGQVRAWFYYVHVVNTSLFGEEAFKNVITTGTLAGNDGRKMSKSLGNFTDPNELMDKFSADSLRFLLLSSPLLNGEDFSLLDKDVGDVARKLSMTWNMYDFFTMYAEVDNWEFDSTKPFDLNPEDLTNPLDKWIVSRVHELNQEVTKHMDDYNIPDAMTPILPLLDDASNWYVRRSRRRFWKSEDDNDKNDAYRTLHYVLLKLSVILAPFTPFLAEELYQKLGGGAESVHLLDWPTDYAVDQKVLDDMNAVRDYVNQGLSLRAKAGIKVRQPLNSVTIAGPHLDDYYKEIITEELNVREVIFSTALEVDSAVHSTASDNVQLDETITPELRYEGLSREVIRFVQAARKSAGLNVDDRIELALKTDDPDLKQAIADHREVIATETLATLVTELDGAYQESVDVEKTMPLSIALRKS